MSKKEKRDDGCFDLVNVQVVMTTLTLLSAVGLGAVFVAMGSLPRLGSSTKAQTRHQTMCSAFFVRRSLMDGSLEMIQCKLACALRVAAFVCMCAEQRTSLCRTFQCSLSLSLSLSLFHMKLDASFKNKTAGKSMRCTALDAPLSR